MGSIGGFICRASSSGQLNPSEDGAARGKGLAEEEEAETAAAAAAAAAEEEEDDCFGLKKGCALMASAPLAPRRSAGSRQRKADTTEAHSTDMVGGMRSGA